MKIFATLVAAMAFSAMQTTATAAGVDASAVALAAKRPIGPGAPENAYTIARGEQGQTIITVTLPGGLRYILLIDQCAAPAAVDPICERLGFFLIYNQTAGTFSADTMNHWNTARPPQAFVAEDGRTMLIHYVLARDGISAGNLAQNFEFWNQAAIGFNNYLASAPKGVTINASAAQKPSAFVGEWIEHGLIDEASGNPALDIPR